MKIQEKDVKETQEVTAKKLLEELIEERDLEIVKLEAITSREAVARFKYPGNELGLVTAEVVDENSGTWIRDTNPFHPNRFTCPDEIPIPAAKAESLNESAIHVIFSPDGGYALLFQVDDLVMYGQLVPAVKGKEAVYLLPASHCLIIQRSSVTTTRSRQPGANEATGGSSENRRSRNFEVRGVGIGEMEILMKAWYSYVLFEGMECFEERPAPDYPVVYLYPDPADLRKRLAELEADPLPVVEGMKDRFSRLEEPGIDPKARLPWVFRSMHRFVDCYERAFANRTEWSLVHNLSEIDVPDVALEQDDDHGSLGERQGETVESGNPSLTEPQRETVPSRRHREPYIIWC